MNHARQVGNSGSFGYFEADCASRQVLRFQFVDPGLNIGCVHNLLSFQLVDLVYDLVDPVGQLRPVK